MTVKKMRMKVMKMLMNRMMMKKGEGRTKRDCK